MSVPISLRADERMRKELCFPSPVMRVEGQEGSGARLGEEARRPTASPARSGGKGQRRAYQRSTFRQRLLGDALSVTAASSETGR